MKMYPAMSLVAGRHSRLMIKQLGLKLYSSSITILLLCTLLQNSLSKSVRLLAASYTFHSHIEIQEYTE